MATCAFAFFEGIPEIVVPDNTKTGAKHPSRFEPDLYPTYQDLAEHYGAVVIPARVRKPKDKAKVEVGVQVVERWIWKKAKVNIDYHVEFDKHYHSAPHQLIGEEVFIQAAGRTVEIFHKHRRVASHPRSRDRYTTQADHCGRTTATLDCVLGRLCRVVP